MSIASAFAKIVEAGNFCNGPGVSTDETRRACAYSEAMNSPETLANLHECRAALAACDVSDELRQLSSDLIGHLLAMHADQRLNAPVFLLALDTLELVPGLEDSVHKLRATASKDVPDRDDEGQECHGVLHL